MLGQNLEVNLRGIAASTTGNERHIDFGKLLVYIENQQRGNYKMHLDPAAFGSDAAIQFNQTWDADPEIAKWLRNRDFRHAVALGIDRDQLNDVLAGRRHARLMSPDDASLFAPAQSGGTKWARCDVNQANAMLDKIGLTQKDSEGFRLRTDGKGRLRIEMITVSGAFLLFHPVSAR